MIHFSSLFLSFLLAFSLALLWFSWGLNGLKKRCLGGSFFLDTQEPTVEIDVLFGSSNIFCRLHLFTGLSKTDEKLLKK